MRPFIFSFLIFLGFAGIFSCKQPVDIRNTYLKNGITEENVQKGKELLNLMEKAYGGRSQWEQYRYGEFSQKADWYGRREISHWDTLPQLFHLKCELGSNNAAMTILNGNTQGNKYWINGNIFEQQIGSEQRSEVKKNSYHEKMVYKNYWFQFPFRIKEATIISYGGEEVLNGKTYELLYATWGEEKANTDYDQFLLYLNKSTYQIEKLHFTVREKMGGVSLTAEFRDFRKVDGFLLPFSQHVRKGKPSKNGIKLHENHYQDIKFTSQ